MRYKIYIFINFESIKLIKGFINNLSTAQTVTANSLLSEYPGFKDSHLTPLEQLDSILDAVLLDLLDYNQSLDLKYSAHSLKSSIRSSVNFADEVYANHNINLKKYLQLDYRFAYIFDPEFTKELEIDLVHNNNNTSRIIDFDKHSILIKDYSSGGLYTRFLNPRYFWRGLEDSNVFKEAKLHQYLEQNNFPVCDIYGFIIYRKGLLYRSNLITSIVNQPQSLNEMIEDQHLPLEQWKELGELIATMHNLGVCHSFTGDNLIYNQQGWHMIDLDGADIIDNKFSPKCPESNIKYFLRSLNKNLNEKQTMFDIYQWEAFTESYYKNINFNY